MNPEAQAVLDQILTKSPEELNQEEISFLRARSSYLKKFQLEEYDDVLKETKPPVTETVKKNAKVK